MGVGKATQGEQKYVYDEDLDAMIAFIKQKPLVASTLKSIDFEKFIVYFGDEVRSVPAPRVTMVDPTGAGDIFATAFLTRLHQTGGDPWEAARFANNIAAQSVTVSGLPHKMRVLQEYVARYD